MRRPSKILIVAALLLMCGIAKADQRVICPSGLKWSSEGYCAVNFTRLGKPECPKGSHLAQPLVTGPMLCISSGACPEAAKPDNRGICVGKKLLDKLG